MASKTPGRNRLKLLYLAIYFFIHIGYIAKFIISLPFRLFSLVLEKVQKIKLPHASIKFPKVFSSRLPRFSFPRLPISIKLKLPKIKVRKVPHLGGGSAAYSPLLFKGKYFILGIVFGAIILTVNKGYNIVQDLPSPKSIGKVNYALTTHIVDRNGKLLYEIYRDQNRTPVKLDELPQYVSQATVAFEDKDFYEHKGVSLSGALRAARETFFNDNLQGGSTITQQLVKSALLTPERTFERKAKEALLAVWTERIYSKEEILEMYLNQVPYGGSSYGIEEAARTFFDKPAKNLNLEEAALLAGLPQAPSIYSPHVNPQKAKERRDEILQKMQEQNFITEEESKRAQKTDIQVKAPLTNIRAPHFVFYIKSFLENLYGIREVEEGGLHVTTTLDLDIQEEVEKILQEEINKIANLNVTNGAVLVTRPSTGEILAMVGSVDYFTSSSGAFNVTTARRQPGSSIKPLMYSLALEEDYTPATVIDDSPVVFSAPGATPYIPVNYDSRFHGRVPLRYALANSYNIPAVKVLNTIGVENFVEHARDLGITTWEDSSRFGLSLTLGGGEVKMTDLATAYGVFANLGKKAPVTGVLKIEDNQGNVLYDGAPKTLQVLDPGVAYQISDILSDNVARQPAFGARSTLEIPGYKAAVKTGTTDDKKDNWTVGFTPEILTAVWVGNNDNTPMHPTLTSGITGASPIWNRVMIYLLTQYSIENRWLERPENIIEKRCYGNRSEYFIQGRESASCGAFSISTPNPSPQAPSPIHN